MRPTWECARPERAALGEELAVPGGAVGAVMYPWLTGGQLQQFVPLFLPFVFCVHQTGLRGKTEQHTVRSMLNICGLQEKNGH